MNFLSCQPYLQIYCGRAFMSSKPSNTFLKKANFIRKIQQKLFFVVRILRMLLSRDYNFFGSTLSSGYAQPDHETDTILPKRIHAHKNVYDGSPPGFSHRLSIQHQFYSMVSTPIVELSPGFRSTTLPIATKNNAQQQIIAKQQQSQHLPQQLQLQQPSPQASELSDQSKFRQLPCRTFISAGTCPYRDRCVYLHDPRVMDASAKSKTRKKNKEDTVVDSLFWPVMMKFEINVRSDNKNHQTITPFVVQPYFVPFPKHPQDISSPFNFSPHNERAVYSIWNHFVAYFEMKNNNNVSYEFDSSHMSGSISSAQSVTDKRLDINRVTSDKRCSRNIQETKSLSALSDASPAPKRLPDDPQDPLNFFIGCPRLKVFVTLGQGVIPSNRISDLSVHAVGQTEPNPFWTPSIAPVRSDPELTIRTSPTLQSSNRSTSHCRFEQQLSLSTSPVTVCVPETEFRHPYEREVFSVDKRVVSPLSVLSMCGSCDSFELQHQYQHQRQHLRRHQYNTNVIASPSTSRSSSVGDFDAEENFDKWNHWYHTSSSGTNSTSYCRGTVSMSTTSTNNNPFSPTFLHSTM